MNVETRTPLNVETRMSLREVVGSLADDVGNLARGEITLARAEMEQKTNRLVGGLISVFGAMLLAYAGLVIVLIAAADALALVIPDWAASLIIGVIVMAIGVTLALVAKRALSPSGMAPQRTVTNLQADAHVLRNHAA